MKKQPKIKEKNADSVWVRPQLFLSEDSGTSLSRRQENEVDSISAIYEGAVRILQLDQASGSVEGWTPVTCYQVTLYAQSDCKDGPTADLEVQYGQLYPLETPMLYLHRVEGLPQIAAKEMHRRMWEEVTKNAGQECIYQVCMVLSEVLAGYRDPADTLDLHSRMMQNEQEKERRKQAEQAAEQERREQAERQRADQWENEKRADQERHERFQAKLHAVERVGEAGRAGIDDFLPDEDTAAGSPRNNPAASKALGPRASKASPRLAAAVSPPPVPQMKKKSPPGSPYGSKAWSPRQTVPAKKLSPVAKVDRTGRNGRPFVPPSVSDSHTGSLDFDLVISERFQGGGDSDLEGLFMPDEGSSGGVAFEASEAAAPVIDISLQPPPSFGNDGGAFATASNGKAIDVQPGRGRTQLMVAEGNNDSVMRRPSQQLAGGGRYAADFEHLAFLGKGGFGSVTKVRHRLDTNLYAVKRIELKRSAKERDRILQECALLPQMHHMHIVRYYQAWIEGEPVEVPVTEAPEVVRGGRGGRLRAQKQAVRQVIPRIQEGDDFLSDHPRGGQSPSPANIREFLYIQMEFCDGTWTLRELIDSGALLEHENRIWKIFRQVLDALAYVHSKGLIHRDLKPANVFLSREDGYTAKLGDFGLTVEVPSAAQQLAGEKVLEVLGQANLHGQQSIGVGTPFYMAPEVRGPVNQRNGKKKRHSVIRAQAYDQKADMFSLGVMFFEMWHPPFSTGMERADVLGRLRDGLAWEQDSPTSQQVRNLLASDPQVPEEVPEILGHLLVRDPEKRPSADWFLNVSGLLPAGAFDPQVQRILKALENPSSGESVALIKALFDRSEDAAKESSFFKQLLNFRRDDASAETEAQNEARDWLLRLFCELCRKHGAVSERCPLLRPVRQARAESMLEERCQSVQACQMVDAGNTLVELRATLTEPLSRVAAAVVAGEVAEQTGCGSLSGMRRHYHTGAVYRGDWDNMSGYGHPREISSAAVQFLWWPPSGMESHPSQRLKASADQIQQVELLHLVAEVLSMAGLPSKAELKLTDTRLLPLLRECAMHLYGDDKVNSLEAASTSLTRERSVSPAPVPKSEKKKAQLSDAFRNAFLSSEQRSRANSWPGDASPSSIESVLLKELEQHYAPRSSADGPPLTAASCPAADRLREVLVSLHGVAKAVEGLFHVTLDIQQPVDKSYGPGLFFRVAVQEKNIICAGGRIDGLLLSLARLHSGGAHRLGPAAEDETKLSEALGQEHRVLHGISVEFAVDKIATALVGATNVPSAVNWRRQQVPACMPHVLVSMTAEDDGDEALKIACGLWKLGWCCEVTAKAVEGLQHFLAESQSDFILELQRALPSPQGDGNGVAASAGGVRVIPQVESKFAAPALQERNARASQRTSSEDLADSLDEACTYLADNSELRSSTPGIAYRQSKSLDDRNKDDESVSWGSYVVGIEEGDHWLRVGSYYLPMRVQGCQVLRKKIRAPVLRYSVQAWSELGHDLLDDQRTQRPIREGGILNSEEQQKLLSEFLEKLSRKQQRQFSEMGLDSLLESSRQPRAAKERVCEFDDERSLLDFFEKLSRKQQYRPPGLAGPNISEFSGGERLRCCSI